MKGAPLTCFEERLRRFRIWRAAVPTRRVRQSSPLTKDDDNQHTCKMVHLEQMNKHGQRLLMPNARDAAAIARHVVHNLQSTNFVMTGKGCSARVADPNGTREQLDVVVLKQRDNTAQEADIAHVANIIHERRVK